MVYSKMKGKHSAKAVFSTQENIEYRKKIGAIPKLTPESIILCTQNDCQRISEMFTKSLRYECSLKHREALLYRINQ